MRWFRDRGAAQLVCLPNAVQLTMDIAQLKNLNILVGVSTLFLVGCGGGGGSTSTVSGSPVVTPPVVAAPPVSLPVQTASLQAAVVPTYAAGSESAVDFAAFNAFRASMGLGPLNQTANIDIATKNHSAYVHANQSYSSAHSEVLGVAGFTGESALQRMMSAGYAAIGSTEVVAYSPSDATTLGARNAIDYLVDSIYHRSAMMTQAITSIGIAPSSGVDPTYIDAGFVTAQKNAGDYLGVYPLDKQTGVLLTHYLESPSPFYLEMDSTWDNMCAKTSYPVTVASEASTVLSVTSFTLIQDGQTTPLEVRLFTKSTSAQDSIYLSANVAHIVAKLPFKVNTVYNAHFVGKATGSVTGTANGMTIDRTWSFTTGTTNNLACH
jgi:uncharacterized protein YkwD